MRKKKKSPTITGAKAASPREPKAIPGAQIAWTAKYDDSDESAVVYAKQWNNPRPGVEIQSLDMVYGKDKDIGVPALLAVTAASAQ